MSVCPTANCRTGCPTHPQTITSVPGKGVYPPLYNGGKGEQEGDLNPQTSHANGGNPTASTLGTDTIGSGGNRVSQPERPVARAHSPPQQPHRRPKWETRESATGGRAGRPGFGENPVAWWPRPEPRAKPYGQAPSQRTLAASASSLGAGAQALSAFPCRSRQGGTRR